MFSIVIALAIGLVAGALIATRYHRRRNEEMASQYESLLGQAYMLGAAEALEKAGYDIRPLSPGTGGGFRRIALERESFSLCKVHSVLIYLDGQRLGVISPDKIEEASNGKA